MRISDWSSDVCSSDLDQSRLVSLIDESNLGSDIMSGSTPGSHIFLRARTSFPGSARQSIVNGGRRPGSLARRYRDLVQPFDHVAGGEHTADRRLLMLIDDDAT